MFEAYSVGIRISLINGVSAGLLGMIRNFRSADLAAAGLQKRMKVIGGMMLVGAGLTGAGLGIFALLEKAAKPAEEYARALNRLNLAGLSQVEIAQAIGGAWKTTGDVMTSTATANLSALLDLRNILGSMQYASRELPMIQKIGAVLSSSSEGKISLDQGQNIAFSMAKALDIIGAARTPEQFEHEATLMAKSITAFQGRVTPKMFQSAFAYARQAKYDLSDQFKYEFLPTLMLEYSQSTQGSGGGSRGVGPMMAALYRVTNQGYVSKKSIPEWERLGLLLDNKFVNTQTTGVVGANVRGSALAAQNPFTWSQEVLIPAIKKALGPNATPEAMRKEVGALFAGNQLAGNIMMEFLSKPQNFLRDQRIIQGAMNWQDAYAVAMKRDPALSRMAMGAQWNNFLTAFGPQIVTDTVSIMRAIAPVLHSAAIALEKNPAAASAWVRAFEALGAVLTFTGGALMLTAVAKALKLVIDVFKLAGPVLEFVGPVVAAIATIPVDLLLLAASAFIEVGAAIYFMWKYWDSSKSVFQNLKTEIGGFLDWAHQQTKDHPIITAAAMAVPGMNLEVGIAKWWPQIQSFFSGFAKAFMDDFGPIIGFVGKLGTYANSLTLWVQALGLTIVAMFANVKASLPPWLQWGGAAPLAAAAAAKSKAGPNLWEQAGEWAEGALFGKGAVGAFFNPLMAGLRLAITGLTTGLGSLSSAAPAAASAWSNSSRSIASSATAFVNAMNNAMAHMQTVPAASAQAANRGPAHVYLDGHKVGRVIADYVAGSVGSVRAGTVRHDPNATLAAPGAGYRT